MFTTDDTIVAVATPAGRAGLGVVRVSGPGTRRVAGRLLVRGDTLQPRYATLTGVRAVPHDAAAPDLDTGTGSNDGNAPVLVDRVVATLFHAPGSYTGDDTLEISAHGNPVLLEEIVAAAVRAGARLARPGEFTLRAFLNGKIDLVQAEAVADLVEAVTPAQARQAFDQLEGTLTSAVTSVAERLLDLVIKLEASLDFPDEGYHFLEAAEVEATLRKVGSDVARLLRGARRGRVIREGRLVVLVGGPNAGKSSLFNALIGTARAIVTDVPGTTRDLVTERCEMGGAPVTLVDTAGLREAAEIVEREGISRTRDAAEVAALLVLVIDGARPLAEASEALKMLAGAKRDVLIVASKSDLPAAWNAGELEKPPLRVSAATGAGLEELRAAVAAALTGTEELEDVPSMSNVRHIALLEACGAAVERAADLARNGAPEELVLTEVQEAIHHVEEVVGRRTPDDILSAIFNRFCIGK